MEKFSSQHPFIKASKELQELCRPLYDLAIPMFNYFKILSNGQRINIASNPQWVVDYYDKKLYQSSQFEAKPKQYQHGVMLWSSTMGSEVLLYRRDYYNSDYGLTLVHPCVDGCEFYFFSGSPTNAQLQMRMLNHLELLEHFILFFKEQFHSQLKPLQTLTHYPAYPQPANEQQALHWSPAQQQAFLTQTPINRLDTEYARFSTRQTQVIKCLLQHQTAADIAMTLKLSRRTVEAYIEEIKNKLNCNTKSELLAVLEAYKGLL